MKFNGPAWNTVVHIALHHARNDRLDFICASRFLKWQIRLAKLAAEIRKHTDNIAATQHGPPAHFRGFSTIVRLDHSRAACRRAVRAARSGRRCASSDPFPSGRRERQGLLKAPRQLFPRPHLRIGGGALI
jgi:hypothetical protein